MPEATIYQQFVHCGEEPELSPAFIVNFSGCSLHCPTCSERIHWETARRVWKGNAADYAAALGPRLRQANIRSFEWIGGEPTLYLPFVLDATALLKQHIPGIPFYLNTNGYYNHARNPEIISCMDGFVFDLKASPGCAEKIVGKSNNYYETVCNNILEACASPCEVIVRHLVMPGHVECCTVPCVRWLRENAPRARINIMTTFQNFGGCPDYPADLPQSDRDLLKQYGLI